MSLYNRSSILRPAVFGFLSIAVLFFLVVPFSRSILRGSENVPSLGSGAITGARVGVNGVWKNGFWTPITIETSGGEGGSLEILAADSDGTPTLLIEKRQSNRQTLYLPLGRAGGTLELRLCDREGQTIDRKEITPPDRRHQYKDGKFPPFLYEPPELTVRPIYLIVGNENIGLSEAIGELLLEDARRPLLVRIRNLSELPNNWYGLEAVERIFLTATDPACLKGVTKESPQIKAIENWTRQGGHLYLLAGKNSLPYLQESGPYVPFVPGVLNEKPQEIRMANSLRSAIPKAKNLVMNGSIDAPFLYVPRLKETVPEAKIVIQEGETPLLVRSPFGFGTITFFGADLSEAPLLRWSARPQLLVHLLGFESGKAREKSTGQALVQHGYFDLSGQLRSSLDIFDGMSVISFSLILLIAFVYILVIGLGDWYITHKLSNNPNITWITFPIYIVLFCVLIVWIGNTMRQNDVRINRAELIDIDMSTGSVRGTTWAGLYSPRDARYDFRLAIESNDKKTPESNASPVPVPASSKTGKSGLKFTKENVLFSWLGLQGDGLGGMAPKTQSQVFWKEPYYLGNPGDELTDLPIKVRSSKSLFGRWFGKMEGLKQSEITAFDGMPKGVIVNPFPVPIKDAILFYGRWAIDMGELQPGENKIVTSAEYGSASERRRRKMVRKELRHVLGTTEDPFEVRSTSMNQSALVHYNPQSQNIPYIMRTIMFYKLAGGQDVTGMDNSYNNYLDSGDLVLTGRAVLIGTVTESKSVPSKQSKTLNTNGAGVNVTESKASESQHETQSKNSAPFPLRSVLEVKDGQGEWRLFGSREESNALKNETIILRLVFPVKE